MRYLLISLILLFSLSGCQDKEQQSTEVQTAHDDKIAQQARAEALAEFEAKKQAQAKTKTKAEKRKDKLDEIGISMDKDVLTIDTNKTKDFLHDLGKKMEVHMKKINQDLDKGIIKSKEAGIDIDNGHINIDLNKTQDLFEGWNKKIQSFVNEFDDVAKSLDDNTTDKKKENNAAN